MYREERKEKNEEGRAMLIESLSYKLKHTHKHTHTHAHTHGLSKESRTIYAELITWIQIVVKCRIDNINENK